MGKIAGELFDTLRKLSALEQRTEDVADYVKRVETKIDSLLERLSKLEEKFDSMRQNVKNEILADMKAEIVRVQLQIDHQQGLLEDKTKPLKRI